MSGKVRRIEKAAVLGSGVMGMAIAAHLSGCGIDCLVLDIVPFDNMLNEKEIKLRDEGSKKVRNKLAAASLKTAMKWKPPQPAFYSKNDAKRITIGNFDDDMEKIGDCDLIVEVVVERMDIKKKILAQIDKYRSEDSIIATNTSGLSVVAMSEDCSEGFKKHFMGAHFFNPVRFMKLLELIPHPETDPEVLSFMEEFSRTQLGKGVIYAKDTPNFIANRIGVHSMFLTLQTMLDMDLRIDEVDAICGKPIGNAKSAVFKTADLVGLDTLSHVAKTVYDNCLDDKDRDYFNPPPFLGQMVEKGWLGRKAKSGFYKRGPKKERLVLDWKTLEYIPQEKPKFASLDAAKAAKGAANRVKALVNGNDKAAEFAWKITAGGLLYAANRIPEISDTVLNIDNGMRWGFNRSIGPFEAWDAIGLRESVERMKADGLEIPANIATMLEKGNESFYKKENGKKYQYDLLKQEYTVIEEDTKVVHIKKYSGQQKVASNDGATLWDMGDGVLLYEMHSKMNAIDNETIDMQFKACDLLDEGKFQAMVLANNAPNFSVGANLMLVMMAVMNDQLADTEKMVKNFQDANMRMKYCSKPVVAAPVGFTFGGGCELTMHANKVVGAAETYIGLVEVGVGLIPAGGGTKELTLRATEGVNLENNPPLLPFFQSAFERMAMATVATGFKAGQDLGLLRSSDIMVTNAEYRISRAKEVALSMIPTYVAGKSRTDIVVQGESATAAFMIAVEGMKNAGWASEHDLLIAKKLAYIVGGGTRAEGQTITEQELLDLELEAFMSLLGEEKTMARMQHMLMHNRPLRN